MIYQKSPRIRPGEIGLFSQNVNGPPIYKSVWITTLKIWHISPGRISGDFWYVVLGTIPKCIVEKPIILQFLLPPSHITTGLIIQPGSDYRMNIWMYLNCLINEKAWAFTNLPHRTFASPFAPKFIIMWYHMTSWCHTVTSHVVTS